MTADQHQQRPPRHVYIRVECLCRMHSHNSPTGFCTDRAFANPDGTPDDQNDIICNCPGRPFLLKEHQAEDNLILVRSKVRTP